MISRKNKQVKKPDYIIEDNTPETPIINMKVVGDFRIGKTSLILRFADSTFTDTYLSNKDQVKSFVVYGNEVKCHIWDTYLDDRHRFDKFRIDDPFERRRPHCAVLLFDLTNVDSLNQVNLLLESNIRYRDDQPMILVGTKADLSSRRAVTLEMIQAVQNKYGIEYVEVSAKNGTNVNQAFERIAELILEKKHPEKIGSFKQWKQKQDIINNKIAQEQKAYKELIAAQQAQRQDLITQLQQYIDRIKSHRSKYTPDEPDFSHGFWFFQASRSLNRQANYLLAQHLITELNKQEQKQTIGDIFKDISRTRNTIIGTHNIHTHANFTNRGIHSNELNRIIKLAKKYGNHTDSSDKKHDERQPLLRRQTPTAF